MNDNTNFKNFGFFFHIFSRVKFTFPLFFYTIYFGGTTAFDSNNKMTYVKDMSLKNYYLMNYLTFMENSTIGALPKKI